MNSKELSNKKRAQIIFKILHKTYPDAKCSLEYQTPYELLIATILSAQCTDKRVNQVTNRLFKKYPNISDYADSDLSELEQDIHSTGFYRNKAKNIKYLSQQILDKYNGQIPDKMEDLLTLPGVGRKTANVLLSNLFDITGGIVVDTHVRRLSSRMNLSNHSNPDKIEADLMVLYKKKQWIKIAHLLIYHGRNICIARKPICGLCPVKYYCPQLFIK